MINYKRAGEKIRLQRKTLGLTQEAVSERIGITPSFLSQVESGARKAGINTFVNLSSVLSLSLDYILGNEHRELSKDNFDEIEYQIFHHLRELSTKEKNFVLNMIIFMINS